MNKSTRPSLDEISDLLVSESREFSKWFMVVDALDECPVGTNTKDKVLSVLRTLPTLHLLVMSRPHVDLNSDFKVVRLDIRADNHDMGVFIQGKIEEDRKLRRYVDKHFKQIVIDKIVKKSDGM